MVSTHLPYTGDTAARSVVPLPRSGGPDAPVNASQDTPAVLGITLRPHLSASVMPSLIVYSNERPAITVRGIARTPSNGTSGFGGERVWTERGIHARQCDRELSRAGAAAGSRRGWLCCPGSRCSSSAHVSAFAPKIPARTTRGIGRSGGWRRRGGMSFRCVAHRG